MSYILDALRKADAQRERDPSRGIHAQASLGTGDDSDAIAPRALTWAAVAAGIVVIAAAGWYFMRSPASPQPSAGQATNNVPPATPLAMQAPVVPPAPSGATAATEISPPPPPAPVHTPPPSFQPRGAAVVQAPAAAAPAPVTGGLPPDAPKVAITGGVYSPDPVQRMLIVNGQVFNEGSEVAPGLSIDKIEARTAIMKFRGARYTVAY